MINPKENTQNQNDVEELAKMFASKIPKVTDYNNAKTRKYFSSKVYNPNDAMTLTLKDNLLYNISTSGTLSISTTNKNDSISISPNSGGVLNLDNVNKVNNTGNTINIKYNVSNIIQNNIANTHKYTKHRKNSSNILIVSKEILKFAERQSTPKILYKIPAKFLEDIIIESDEEDLTEKIPSNFKHNKTVDNMKRKNRKADSFLAVKEKLNNTDIDFLNSNHKLDINFDSLLTIEQIYSSFLLEKRKPQSEYDSLISKYFDVLMNTYNSVYVLEHSLNDKSVQQTLKQFFVQEVIIFALCFMRNLDKNDALFNAFKNCLFYMHQNLIILLFICTVICGCNNGTKNDNTKDNKDNKDNINSGSRNNSICSKIYEHSMKQCKEKVEENKIWLNKNNYKKYMKNNNKTVVGILKNILKVIKASELENANRSSQDIKNIVIIINYIKNLGKYKTEVVRDNIYKNLISSKTVSKEIVAEHLEMINNEVVEDESHVNFVESKEENNKENCQNSESESVNIIPPSVPFLPEKVNFSKQYTLVLDLDETLVHYVEDEDSAYIQIRPGAEKFLEEMFEYFEIVVFTAAMQDYADLVLDELDKNKRISYRLYRQHTINFDTLYIKDLNKLGRRPSKTLIIDNVADNFQLQPENGINIKNFEGDENDVELIELAEDLKNIVKSEIDVRDALPSIRDKMTERNKNTDPVNNITEGSLVALEENSNKTEDVNI